VNAVPFLVLDRRFAIEGAPGAAQMPRAMHDEATEPLDQ
jgi:hypothetical protein